MTAKTYELGEREGEPSIKCLKCGARSFNPHDITARYCAGCHTWHEGSLLGAARQQAEEAINDPLRTAQYSHDLEGMLSATKAWHTVHPDAKLRFHRSTFFTAPLTVGLIARLAADPLTHDLLRAMHVGARQRGTLLMAEACVEEVFGIAGALTANLQGEATPTGSA